MLSRNARFLKFTNFNEVFERIRTDKWWVKELEASSHLPLKKKQFLKGLVWCVFVSVFVSVLLCVFVSVECVNEGPRSGKTTDRRGEEKKKEKRRKEKAEKKEKRKKKNEQVSTKTIKLVEFKL